MTDKAILVCAPFTEPLYLPDNLTATCDVCGIKLQHRPHAPPSTKRCMDCALSLMHEGEEMEIPAQMLEDARAYFRKKQQ